MKRIQIILLSILFSLPLFAQDPGTYDSDFGEDGIAKVFVNTTGYYLDYANAMVILPDDKIILIGDSWNDQTYEAEIVLVRLNPDGTVDTSFGTGGFRKSKPARDIHVSNGIVASDGKIIVVGFARGTASNASRNFLIARFNANGTPDTSFGSNGSSLIQLGPIQDWANDVIVLSNGKIVIVGDITFSSNYINRSFGIVRLNSNGTLDTSFGNGGKVITSMSERGDDPRRVHELPNGKILVTGFSNNGSFASMTAVRYNENGTLDTSYGNGGIAAHEIGGLSSTARQSIILPDGKALLCGYSIVDNVSVITFIRLNDDGSLDTSFGTAGLIQLPAGLTSSNTSFSKSISGLIIQPDGKIVISGTRRNTDGDDDIALVRLLSDFSLDDNFGNGGVVYVQDIGSFAWEQSSGVSMQSNGRLLVAGYYSVNSLAYSMVVLGFNSGFSPVSIDADESTIPKSITLHQNYPNPFNPGTIISFSIPEPTEVQLDVYTLNGIKVATLIQSHLSAGTHSISFDGSNLGSGVYLYQLRTGFLRETKLMTLLK